MSTHRRSGQGLALLACLALTLPLLVGQGCPPGVVAGGAPTTVVRFPNLDRSAAIGETLTIVYDAVGATSVRAFYDRDKTINTGDEVVFSGNLPAGSNQVAQMATASLPAGTYYLGITASNSAGTSSAYGAGKITLVASAQVKFLSPAQDMRVGAGVSVPIRFDAGVTAFDYRVFIDGDSTANGNETTIATGSSSGSSAVQVPFDTSPRPAGTYYVGCTVTTPAGASRTAYASHTITVTTGAYVQLLAPTFGLAVSPGDFVQVVVAANDPQDPAAQVRVFHDTDNQFGNGNEVDIAILPQISTGTVWDTTGVGPGFYYVGAELQNGLTPPLVSYSPGPLEVLGQGGGIGGGGTLTVTTPTSAVTVLEGAVYRIGWTVNLARGEGVVRIFREPDLNNDGVADGVLTRVTIVDGVDATSQFQDWNTSGAIGKFFIGATLTPLTGDPTTSYARGTVTVSRRAIWAGRFDTKYDGNGLVVPQTGYFQGAAFRGHNFRDNLGSAMIATDDYDGDRRNEIVLVAQFGKPFLFRIDGRGAGEGYLIYGLRGRYAGNYEVNTVGQDSRLPGVIFSGVVPNPFAASTPNEDRARAGNSTPYKVEGGMADAFDSEGLRSVTLIPDQDGDGKQEIVFGVPWCNSYSLSSQVAHGIHPAPLAGLGRLENNGHFLRGGVVAVSSRNSLLANRQAISRHFDRVMQLDEVGQVFNPMVPVPSSPYPYRRDLCPPGSPDGTYDYVTWPCEGFTQNTAAIDPPRLATPPIAGDLIIPPSVLWPLDDQLPGGCGETIAISQVDTPPPPSDPFFVGGRNPLNYTTDACTPVWPALGLMHVLGTGFYSSGTTCGDRVMAEAREPYGCRILGQTTTQCPAPPVCDSYANRFGASLSKSGDFLLIGAPLRTATRGDVPTLPTADRREAGVVYVLQLRRPGYSASNFFWSVPDVAPAGDLPAPHNFIIDDLGYFRCDGVGGVPGTVAFEMARPMHVVGGAPGDRVGDVTGLHDINNDGVEDFAVAAPNALRITGEAVPRGAVYVIYRRQSEVEGDYLLEDLARDPATDPNRLNGLMIIGEEGENIGRSMAGGGPLNDDYNNDGYADVLIGSPDAQTAGGPRSGEVFILFGGRNLLNPQGGITLAQLRDRGDGMLLIGERQGDQVGMTLANAGDVNGDRIPDILVAAPGASPYFDSNGDGVPDTIGLDLNGDRIADDLNLDGVGDNLAGAGVVYVVYGGSHLTGTIPLSKIGTAYLPGFIITGRKAGDGLGGGLTQNGLLSRGVSPAGDLDGDGLADLLVSSILADPEGKTDAGEVYLIYGFRP